MSWTYLVDLIIIMILSLVTNLTIIAARNPLCRFFLPQSEQLGQGKKKVNTPGLRVYMVHRSSKCSNSPGPWVRGPGELYFQFFKNVLDSAYQSTIQKYNGIGKWRFLRPDLRAGVQALQFRKHDFDLWVGVIAWACTNNLRVVLGPCAQYCPSEASEQRMGQKRKT